MPAPTLSLEVSPDHRCGWSQASTPPRRDVETSNPVLPECVASTPTPRALSDLQAALESWVAVAIAPVRFNLDEAAAALLVAIFELLAAPRQLPPAPGDKIGAAAPASEMDVGLIDALRHMAADAGNAGHPDLAYLLHGMAAWSVAPTPSDTGRAARALGVAAAGARKTGWLAIAEAVWRESLRIDPSNVRNQSSLGQLLHSRCRHQEAVALLEPIRDADNYARLFLGLSQMGSSAHGDARAWQVGLDNVVAALRTWAIGADDGARTAWLRQVRQLWFHGLCQSAAEQLIVFANRHARWRAITPDELSTAATTDHGRTGAPAPGIDPRSHATTSRPGPNS